MVASCAGGDGDGVVAARVDHVASVEDGVDNNDAVNTVCMDSEPLDEARVVAEVADHAERVDNMPTDDEVVADLETFADPDAAHVEVAAVASVADDEDNSDAEDTAYKDLGVAEGVPFDEEDHAAEVAGQRVG